MTCIPFFYLSPRNPNVLVVMYSYTGFFVIIIVPSSASKKIITIIINIIMLSCGNNGRDVNIFEYPVSALMGLSLLLLQLDTFLCE